MLNFSFHFLTLSIFEEDEVTVFTHPKLIGTWKNLSDLEETRGVLEKLDQTVSEDMYLSIAYAIFHDHAYVNKRWPMSENWSWLNTLYRVCRYSRASTMPWLITNFKL